MFEKDGFDRETIEHYIDALRVPGAFRSAISYYRAAVRRVLRGDLPTVRVVDKPVLVLWGDADRFIGKELAEPPKRFVPDARVVHIPGATHWVQNAVPDEVSRRLVEFFGVA
jgi:pimeloyl-ACP methyl ester carboxylesterase